MPERRGSRFVIEALFLAALAVALALAQLDALEIVGAMALGWLVIAVLEWVAWRSDPHFGAGLPPRYFLPRVDLPPPQPLEQVVQGYPNSGRDDAPTWIASAAVRAEVLGEWPVYGPVQPADNKGEEEPGFVGETEADDPWTAIELPPMPDDQAKSARVVRAPLSRRELTSGTAHSWYTFDPLGDPGPRRLSRRGRGSADDTRIQVPSLPAKRPGW